VITDLRRLAAIVALVVLVAVVASTGLTIAGRSSGGGPGDAPTSTSTPSSSLVPSAAPGAGSVPSPDAAAVVDPPADLAGARSVASDFALAYSTYRFDEPVGAALDRVARLVTPDALAVLAASSGGGAEQERRVARHETVDASVDGVLTDGFTADEVLLLVVVTERVRSDEGELDRSVAYHVSVRPGGDGWVVSGVSPE
jgi:hypothetical protein